MLFDRQLQILVAEKQFVHYDIYKNNFDRINSIKPMQESSLIKLPFMIFKKKIMFKDKLYFVLFIFIRIFSKNS